MSVRAGAAALRAAAALLVLAAAGCETTQQLSAKLGRQLGPQNAIAGTTAIGARNRSVRILRTELVPGNPAAVVLEVENTGATVQVAMPVLIVVRDSKGATVYRNDTKGIEPSLQQLALLPGHATAWWVDNEVLASGGVAASVTAEVGASSTSAPVVPPRLTATGVSASNSFPGPHVDATIHNASRTSQRQLPVYAVALRGTRVIGAGRGIVPALPAGSAAAIVIPMAGAVTGATTEITIAPSPN